MATTRQSGSGKKAATKGGQTPKRGAAKSSAKKASVLFDQDPPILVKPGSFIVVVKGNSGGKVSKLEEDPTDKGVYNHNKPEKNIKSMAWKLADGTTEPIKVPKGWKSLAIDYN